MLRNSISSSKLITKKAVASGLKDKESQNHKTIRGIQLQTHSFLTNRGLKTSATSLPSVIILYIPSHGVEEPKVESSPIIPNRRYSDVSSDSGTPPLSQSPEAGTLSTSQILRTG